MDMILINVVLCELATNHRTSSIYVEGLDVNMGPNSVHEFYAPTHVLMYTNWHLELELTIM